MHLLKLFLYLVISHLFSKKFRMVYMVVPLLIFVCNNVHITTNIIIFFIFICIWVRELLHKVAFWFS